jgi:predicted metal-dependent hydrolase
LSLPEYSIRLSLKATRLQLRIKKGALEVVVPRHLRVAASDISILLQTHAKWIDRHIKLSPKVSLQLPDAIHLQGIKTSWTVHYEPLLKRSLRIYDRGNGQLILLGDQNNKLKCILILRKWLKLQAARFLPKYLSELSIETGLPFESVAIRHNETRWGSCSSRARINLNSQLLFFPKNLIRHVLLHELCHTKFMHHGKNFHALLEKYDKSAKIHAALIKELDTLIPPWVNADDKSFE